MARVAALASILRAFVLASIYLSTLSLVHAQIMAVSNTTAPPAPGVGHDYIKMFGETVNPANGSVSLRIDLPMPKNRGLDLPFAILYSSSGVHNVGPGANGAAVWFTDIGQATGSGWSYSIPTLTAVQGQTTHADAGPPPQTDTCTFISSYILRDWTGAMHPLGLILGQDPTAGGNCFLFQPSNISVLSGGDDYFKAVSAACVSGCTASSPKPVTIAGPNGTVYGFSSFGANSSTGTNAYWGAAQSMEDRNGNVVHFSFTNTSSTGTSGTITDTLGRTALTISPITASTNTLTVSGLTTPFTQHWITAPSNFSVGQTQLPSTPCGSIAPNHTGDFVVQTLTLPNEESFTFQYDSVYGLLSKITYPGGGYISYTWSVNSRAEITGVTNAAGQTITTCYLYYDTPAISQRQVSYDGVNVAEKQTFAYATTWNGLGWTSKQTTVTTSDLVRGQSYQTIYTYAPILPEPSSGGSPNQFAPMEQSVVYKDFSGAVLRTVTKGWLDQNLLGCDLETLDNGLISGKWHSYGSGGQLTDNKEFDYGLLTSTSACHQPSLTGGPIPAPSGITPTRETVNTYQTFGVTPIFPSGPSIFDRPSSTITYGSGSRVAETDFLYDTVGVSSVAATGHDDTGYGTTFNVRGNLTKNIQKCFVGATACTDAVSTYVYDQTGQVLSMIDPCGNASCSDMIGTNHTTAYSYADSFSSGTPPGSTNAYLTRITDPLGHTNNFSYAYADGQLTASTDANGQATQYLYGDSLRRLTETDYPDSGKTTLSYDDAAPSPKVTQTRLITSSPSVQLSTTAVLDGMGHVVQNQLTTDPDGTDLTDTAYDGTGHVLSISNPHRSTSSPTDGTTTYTYDALGRGIKVTQPDSSTVITNYAGTATDIMDEGNGNGVKRVEHVSQIDGLGRLVSVCEVTNSAQLGLGGTAGACGQNIAKTGFLTSYSYDALDNLVTVTQGSLSPRTFAYNSLSRLLCAANPEIASVVCPNPDNGSYTAGTIRYSYDVNGNRATKMVPKPNQLNTSVTATATYGYDTLNRMTGISYNDGSTPSVANLYDQSSETGAANDIGRRTYASVSSGSTLLYKRSLVTYDPMGRLQLEYECAPDTCALDRYNVGYAYDLIGDEKSVTAGFPAAGSQTQTNLYTSAGRLQKVSTTLAQFSILDSIHYTPAGAMLSASVGPSMAESWAYNNRGRIASIAAAGPGSGGLQNFYTESLLYAPNGDVTTLNDSVNGNWLNTYDDFNRLSTAVASNVGEGCSFGYDRYGNRWQESPSGGTCNSRPLSFNAGNRIVGYNYDAAGNLLNDGSHAYSYDAENRILSVDGSTTYVYDADGRRVGKKTGSVFVAEYILDQDGRQLAQLGVGGNLVRGEVYAGGQHVATYNGAGLYFSFPDGLGTERIRRNADGSALETCTNLPFGDSQQCSGSDVSALHFTGKERDSESGLDYFIHRHYANTMGRFMQPDPDGISSSRRNPQSWNMYAYVLNNPLRFTDPDGMNYTVCDTQGKNCADLTDKQYDQWRKDNANVQVSASGAISIVNDNGSTTKVGQESYYNEKDIQAAQQLVATQGLILNLGVRMYVGGITGGAFGWAAGEFIGGLAEGLSAEGEVAATAESGANTIVGSRRSPISVATGTNEGTEIGGRWYTGHALDQMQGRGLMPSVIEDTIKTGTASPGNTAGTTVYATGQARVVVNSAGDVVTAMPK